MKSDGRAPYQKYPVHIYPVDRWFSSNPLMSLDVNLFQFPSPSYVYLITVYCSLEGFPFPVDSSKYPLSYRSSIGHLHLASECQSGTTFQLCRVCQARLHATVTCNILVRISLPTHCPPIGVLRSYHPYYSPQLPCLPILNTPVNTSNKLE